MNREQALDQWLETVLGTSLFKRVLLSGDASFRRYYRVWQGDKPYVVMDAPAPEEPSLFVEVASVLRAQGLSVPQVFAMEVSQGFLLLTDFGDQLYLNELHEQTAQALYQDAFKALIQIQLCSSDAPAFDNAFLKRQMDIFKTWFLEKNLKIAITNDIEQHLDNLLSLFVGVMQEQPQVFVHRDYHSRNLMVLEKGNPGILDFQDAMKGPITYDLVSLLQDCYITWPREAVEDWVAYYHEKARSSGILKLDKSKQEFLRWFDLTGLQRHLKNLGIFSRLCYRDGKSQYLKDIPRLYRYIQETMERYSELLPYADFFERILHVEVSACVP